MHCSVSPSPPVTMMGKLYERCTSPYFTPQTVLITDAVLGWSHSAATHGYPTARCDDTYLA